MQQSRCDPLTIIDGLAYRAGHECRVRFFAHMHPGSAADAGRDLTPTEDAALQAAIAEHGVRRSDALRAATGLQWPRWRLLAAARRLEARALTTEGWDASRDAELQAVTRRLMREAPPGRKVSWLVRRALAGLACASGAMRSLVPTCLMCQLWTTAMRLRLGCTS